MNDWTSSAASLQLLHVLFGTKATRIFSIESVVYAHATNPKARSSQQHQPTHKLDLVNRIPVTALLSSSPGLNLNLNP
jgi:hypothetical protein